MHRKAITYEDEDDGTTVTFVKVTGVPGYTHKVMINGNGPVAWLSDNFHPSTENAEFFAQRYSEEVQKPTAGRINATPVTGGPNAG